MTASFRSSVRAVPALLLWIGSLPVLAADAPEPRTLSVTGQGKVTAAPDVVDVHAAVVTQAPTAREALSANNEQMTGVLAVLKKQGIADKDVQTTRVDVQPVYSQPRPAPPGQPQPEFVPRVVGYRVENGVRFTSRVVANVGAVLDALVSAGAGEIRGISFRIDQSEALLDEARKKAMADAKRKANLLAADAGMALGLPLSVRDEASPAPPPRFKSDARMMAAAPMSAPVAAGEETLEVTVYVVYEMTPAK